MSLSLEIENYVMYCTTSLHIRSRSELRCVYESDGKKVTFQVKHVIFSIYFIVDGSFFYLFVHIYIYIYACLVVIVCSVGHVDTVVMNPPFGTRKKGVDMDFLSMALKVGTKF